MPSLHASPVPVQFDPATHDDGCDCHLCDDDSALALGIETDLRTAVAPESPPSLGCYTGQSPACGECPACEEEIAWYRAHPDYDPDPRRDIALPAGYRVERHDAGGFRPWCAWRDGVDAVLLDIRGTQDEAAALCWADAGARGAEETDVPASPADRDWWSDETRDGSPSDLALDVSAARRIARAAAFALGRALGRMDDFRPAPPAIAEDEGLLEEFERGQDRARDEEEVEDAMAERYAPQRAWNEAEIREAGHNPGWTMKGGGQ